MDTEIKCCPFCGGDNLFVIRLGAFAAMCCLQCGATGPKAERAEPTRQVRQLWNERQGGGD